MAKGGKVIGADEVKPVKKLIISLVAEFCGTMLLVLIGCGACVNPTASTVQIALAFGFIIASMVQSIGHVSGCHINPAVTLGLFAMGRIGLVKGLIYMVTQCAGALVGAAILKYIVNNGIYVSSLGATQLHPSIDVGQGIAIEAIITSVLVLVVGAVTDPDRKEELGNAAPVAIGLAIACSHLFAVPLTGSGMNPARSLGPAAVASTWENHWVYWVGPLLGAAIAGLVYRFVFSGKDGSQDSYDP